MSITSSDRISIERQLTTAIEIANAEDHIELPLEVCQCLDDICDNMDRALSGYLNVLTCLICSSIDPNIDPRYHRQPGNGMPEPEPADGWLSGRVISEKIIYPWLNAKGLRTAKSGWQTRTYERPNPYTLDYPENIAFIKSSFLGILDYGSREYDARILMVAYLLRRETLHGSKLEKLKSSVSKSRVGNEVLIVDILAILTKHFELSVSAHLPVVAIYSIYESLIQEVSQYNELKLRPLERHQAADSRTGAVGDIELEDGDGDVVEGVEVKHRIEVDISVVMKAQEKILTSPVKRYYILTTHANCNSTDEAIIEIIRSVYREHGCQVIVNGALPTLKYYLRMLKNPSSFVDAYSRNLASQPDVTTKQLTVWRALVEALRTGTEAEE